jgi:hypothetical protein
MEGGGTPDMEGIEIEEITTGIQKSIIRGVFCWINLDGKYAVFLSKSYVIL